MKTHYRIIASLIAVAFSTMVVAETPIPTRETEAQYRLRLTLLKTQRQTALEELGFRIFKKYGNADHGIEIFKRAEEDEKGAAERLETLVQTVIPLERARALNAAIEEVQEAIKEILHYENLMRAAQVTGSTETMGQAFKHLALLYAKAIEKLENFMLQDRDVGRDVIKEINPEIHKYTSAAFMMSALIFIGICLGGLSDKFENIDIPEGQPATLIVAALWTFVSFAWLYSGYQRQGKLRIDLKAYEDALKKIKESLGAVSLSPEKLHEVFLSRMSSALLGEIPCHLLLSKNLFENL